LPFFCGEEVMAFGADRVVSRGGSAFGGADFLAAAGLGGSKECEPLEKALRIPINRGWARLIGRILLNTAGCGGVKEHKPLEKALRVP
jgi:hypothetical protein